MERTTIQLKHTGTDIGFCRVEYKSERHYYCLMDDGYSGHVDMKFFWCSKDGEPIEEVDPKGFIFPIIGAKSGIEKDADDWIKAGGHHD